MDFYKLRLSDLGIDSGKFVTIKAGEKKKRSCLDV